MDNSVTRNAAALNEGNIVGTAKELSANPESPEGRELFNDWIERNVRKIKDSEFAHIDQENMNIQTRKMIVKSIRQAVDNMEV